MAHEILLLSLFLSPCLIKLIGLANEGSTQNLERRSVSEKYASFRIKPFHGKKKTRENTLHSKLINVINPLKKWNYFLSPEIECNVRLKLSKIRASQKCVH